MRRIGILLAVTLIALVFTSSAHAQTSRGQICVQLFDDRNGNGSLDPGEPPITQFASATLSDASGVIVNTLAIEDTDAPNRGIICFQLLEAGSYTVTLSSAEFIATTTETFTVTISDTSVELLEFGGRRIVSEGVGAATPDEDEFIPQPLLERIFFAGLGAAFVMGVMAVIGGILYLILSRRRSPVPAVRATGTGSMPAVQAPPVIRVGGTGSMPPVQNVDTGPMSPVSTASIRRVDDESDFDYLDDLPLTNEDDTDERFRPPHDE